MEINDIGGLPAHPLVVHLPVVLVPLATLAATATQLATGSGESLEERVRESDLIETHSRIAEQARPWIFAFAIVMIVAVVIDLLVRRSAAPEPEAADAVEPAVGGSGGGVAVATRPRTAAPSAARMATAAIVLCAAGVGLGAVSTVQVYRTGRSGAKATWHDTEPAQESSGSQTTGDCDEDRD